MLRGKLLPWNLDLTPRAEATSCLKVGHAASTSIYRPIGAIGVVENVLPP